MPQRPAAGTRPDWSARPCAGASAEGGRGGGREGGGGRGEEKAERHCEESRRRAPTAWLCTGSPLRAASLHTAQGRANARLRSATGGSRRPKATAMRPAARHRCSSCARAARRGRPLFTEQRGLVASGCTLGLDSGAAARQHPEAAEPTRAHEAPEHLEPRKRSQAPHATCIVCQPAARGSAMLGPAVPL
ncbi:unnamed protein product [Prorocentrum cordatum]|uniref:Uncharacterized protein n=1 Tax=Prorocentrum cordatum TaxID=2364126 RepID=A0ABN9SMV2_9DINO|nr:unnamed protein product [Polarella glacialis]